MKFAVVGTGNVGSALLLHLAELDGVDHVMVMNIEDEWSNAAIMDVASVYPKAAQDFSPAPYSSLSYADLIFMTAGVQIRHDQKGQDVLQENLELSLEILSRASLKHDALLIALATPVDKLTAHLAENLSLPLSHIIGFGGDLDCNRLRYVLEKSAFSVQKTHVVGEHGGNIIPVYEGEKDFDDTTKEVRSFLSNITSQGGRPRNLATGALLARLSSSILDDTQTIHHVCGYHPAYKRYLTWPFPIGRTGFGQPIDISIGPKAREALETLLGVQD